VNAVEIEAAVSALAAQPIDPEEFPFTFLQAFGNKQTTLIRLRKGESNKSDLGGVLQIHNIHIAVCAPGAVRKMLAALKASPATARAKAKFVLATDGHTFEAEDLTSGETVACAYAELPDHFGFFLPLAGITTVKQVRDSSFDIRATSRLNRLYVELLKDNPEWGTAERRLDMNHFLARLIFCFFAEDTDIFSKPLLFTSTVEQMCAKDSFDTHEVIGTVFRAMNTRVTDRAAASVPLWADQFPYVNGWLFSGSMDVPRFSRIARSYLLHIGGLDWKRINPDIFGSMIQAVAEDEERGALGMHYTSVPNILKLLNPLFLDHLRAQLDEAGDNPRRLLNLRNRMSRIRVFDPACGSGNFLVIAYKEMRAIEAEINRRRGEPDRRSEISLTNFRGIEVRSFPAEIARLALVIAEYQCDVLYSGRREALRDLLPLDTENWIICGNALRLDWLSICPPEGGETYVCGNPPYLGSTWQSHSQKSDLKSVFAGRTRGWKSLDYVAGWFMKAAEYGSATNAVAAFVSTNSICQGQQVPILWPLIFATGHEIAFAHTSFKWANLASHKAGVTVVIIGISRHVGNRRRLFSISDEGTTILKSTESINAYLVPGPNIIVRKRSKPLCDLPEMDFGSKPVDGGHLFLDASEAKELLFECMNAQDFVRAYSNSEEFIHGKQRYCLWIDDTDVKRARGIQTISQRLDAVAEMRRSSSKAQTRRSASTPHKFGEIRHRVSRHTVVVPRVSSENRDLLPVGLVRDGTIVGDRNFALYDAPLWSIAVIASRLHWVWIATVCVRLEMRFSYSNTLGWNTFPLPMFTEKNQQDVTRCAEDILLAREAYSPATIADLYESDTMPAGLREAHERNDEVLERIYIGRRFRNDTERLEKLFELYTEMTERQGAIRNRKAGRRPPEGRARLT